jgi:hypothetical protein
MSLRPLILNYKGHWLLEGQIKTPFDVLTLANQDGPGLYEKDLTIAEEYLDKAKENQEEILSFDLVYCFAFLVFIRAFKKVSDSVIRKNQEAFERPSDYTVSVWGLPHDAT